jgi:hypothetical protein
VRRIRVMNSVGRQEKAYGRGCPPSLMQSRVEFSEQELRQAARVRFAFVAAYCADARARGVEPDYFAPILHLPLAVYWLIGMAWKMTKP